MGDPIGKKLLPQEPFEDLRRGYYLHDDFETYTDAKVWTAALTNSSAPTVSSSLQDGVLVQLNSGATNDASFIFTTIPLFKFGNNRTHCAEFLLQFTEASTNQANIWCGLTSVNTVSMLVNASAGPATSGTFAGIYKTGGSLTWRTASSQSTAQTLTNTLYTAGQSAYQRLRVECTTINTTGAMEITYWIDQNASSGNAAGLVQMKDATTRQNPIKDTITLSSPAAMYLGIGVKNGSANAETLNVDYASGWKLRSNMVAST